jgi:predicted lipoprotein with Yx(FWY)xxD motif
VWRPLLVSGKIMAGSGVALANLGVIILPDGTRQVTYKGYPLYTYTKDLKPGDTNGHGIDGKWLLVTP